MTRSFTLVTQYFPPERGAAQVRLGCIVAELADRGYDTGRGDHRPRRTIRQVRSSRAGSGGRDRLPKSVGCRGRVPPRPSPPAVWVWAAMGSGASRLVNYLSFGAMSLLPLVRLPTPEWYVVEYPTLFGAFPAVCWARFRRRKVVVIVADLWVDSPIVEIGRSPHEGSR